MTWQQWALIGSYVVSAVWGVLMIDEEREPYTKRTAVLGLAISAGFIWLVVSI